jgi:hypothetical protein
MDVMERGIMSMRKVCKHWNIPITKKNYHLNGKTKTKNVGPPSIPIDEKGVILLPGFLVCMNVD